MKVLPICYDKEFAWDLDECAAFEQVSVEEFIRMHSEHEYYAYMLGVAPGHAYMARFEEPFHFKRRTEPRGKDQRKIHCGGGKSIEPDPL